ncbi:MAG: class I SAM-dependent methyltransferase [Bdellovibrionales bacterium]|nr:class I SAM-dependent methyltransferase [Bdellovibrionales bacterium]
MTDFSTPYSAECLGDIFDDDEFRGQQFSLRELYGYDHQDREFDEQFGFTAPFEKIRARSEDQFSELSLAYRFVVDLVGQLGLHKGDTVLDVGSGTGRLGMMLHHLTGASVHGIELEPTYVEYANRRVAEAGFERVRFEVGDASLTTDFRKASVVTLINPFRGELLERFLENLRGYLSVSERPVALVHQGLCSLQIINKDWLHAVDESSGIDEVAIRRLASHG